ncbi:nucleotidyltransferase domain-containing protein [Metabacillus litoralis]|uniref:nucleotidyltransferase domain-containing protein n=1 Tax=Metabacillus litoralis TaxID=152268 RepID=UPI001CFDD07C|nr:nucleotidyltransferase domain-containing protein [Metabacillus litoralis]
MLKTIKKAVLNISHEFSKLNEVEAVVLSGSLGANTEDEYSDIDLYIYSDVDIPINKRKEIFEPLTNVMEYHNQFWETEDDGILIHPPIGIEVIYRNINSMKKELENTLTNFQANVGYSTCFWSNVLNSEILYDKFGRLEELQKKCKIPYPPKLKRNIIEKNYPLLRDSVASYYHQIDKALKRNDHISVNHRITAFLASYFDIIFAVNELPHPGEKKLATLVKSQCKHIPENMEKSINKILHNKTETLLEDVSELIDNLDKLLVKQNLKNK